MPILSAFPDGCGTGGGIPLSAVTNIATLVSSGRVYVKWTDPDNLVTDDGTVISAWEGTLLVRKSGSMPISRYDGTVVIDSKGRNAYQDAYFCDSGLANGETYYYKFFSYSTDGAYTDSVDNEFIATPTAQVTDIDDWLVTSISVSYEAGDGKMTVRWTDPADNITVDGIDLATWDSTTIVVKDGSYATSKDDSGAVYILKVTTRNLYSNADLTVTGLTNGTTYYISLFPETKDGGVNTSELQRATGMANRITIATTPSQSSELVYDGNSHSPTWTNYDSAQLTIGGETLGVNAGSYIATFTPTKDYRWDDGTTTAKDVTWTIKKAEGSMGLSDTEVVLGVNATSVTVEVTRPGNGAISAVSSNTDVASVTVNGTTLTIGSVNENPGTATITVSVASDDNYTVPEDALINVTADFLPLKGTPLNDCSWDHISQIAANGDAGNYFSVGDIKLITINGAIGNNTDISGSYYVYIIGFNHNGSTNTIDFGTFKYISEDNQGLYDICLTDSSYGMTNSYPNKHFNMNEGKSTNVGGWRSCKMRYSVLGSTDTDASNASSTTATNPLLGTLMSVLPADLRAVMKPMEVYTDNAGGNTNVAASVSKTVDYLPMMSPCEVFGLTGYGNAAEKSYQKQYTYYSNGNSKVKLKVVDKCVVIGAGCSWWLRSPITGNDQSFCSASVTGDGVTAVSTAIPARQSSGIAPIFRV